MLENSPIMPALCLMLFSTYYAQNYAGIIYLGLSTRHVAMTNNISEESGNEFSNCWFSKYEVIRDQCSIPSCLWYFQKIKCRLNAVGWNWRSQQISVSHGVTEVLQEMITRSRIIRGQKSGQLSRKECGSIMVIMCVVNYMSSWVLLKFDLLDFLPEYCVGQSIGKLHKHGLTF